MAAPDPYVGTEEEFNPDLHWGAFPASALRTYTGESVESRDASGENFFSQENAEVSMKGVVNSSRIRGFLRYCLGYNNMTTTAAYTLQRTNPICHPRFTNMVCTGVAHRPFLPIRYADELPPIGSTNSGLKLARNQDTSGVVAVTEAGPGSTPHTFPYYTGWSKEEVTIRFSPAPYRFVADIVGLKEYQRNTIIDVDPRTEVLTLSGFQIIYAEGDGNTDPPTSNPKSKAAPADVYQVLAKPDLKVIWHRVPEKFISSSTLAGQLRPTKILAGLGKLNAGTWLNYPQGTLLFIGARFVRKPWALAAGAVGTGVVPTSVRESIFNYDVEFLFSYFDPVKGYASDAQITNALTFGHNCLPWRGNSPGTVLASDDLNQGRWFFATYSGLLNSIGTSGGSRAMMEYVNYDTLFESVGAWS